MRTPCFVIKDWCREAVDLFLWESIVQIILVPLTCCGFLLHNCWRLVPTRLDGTLAKCRWGEVTNPSTRSNWRNQTDRCWAPTRQRQLTRVRVNEGRCTWLGSDEAKVTPFINIFRLLLRRGDGDVTTKFWRHKVTHNYYAIYRIWLWRRSIKYLMTINRSLIGGFPQARLAYVINRTRLTGPRNRRTTQFLYKSDLSLSMTLKTEEDIFSLIMYFVYSKKN